MPVNDLEFPSLSEAGQSEFFALLSRYRLTLFERLVSRLFSTIGAPGEAELDAMTARYLEQLLSGDSLPKSFVRAHIDNWATIQLLQQAANPGLASVNRARLFDELARTIRDRATDQVAMPARPPDVGTIQVDQPGLRIAFDAARFGVRSVCGNAKQEQDFARQLARASAIITRTAPEIADWIQVIVPLVCWLGPCASDGTSRSESYAPGGPIFLSSTTGDWELAENLVHETQHHRFHLWALSEPFASITSGKAEFVSPWRRDIRPLYGLHLGLHAFLLVNTLRLRFGLATTPTLLDRFAQTHASNLFAFRTIVSFDSPTQQGRDYLLTCAHALSEHDIEMDRLDGAAKVDAVLDRLGAHCERGQREFPGLRNASAEFRNRESIIALTKSLKDFHDEDSRLPLSR